MVVVHGRQDDLIPLEHSMSLARDAACEVMLWLVNDEHRLVRSVDEGLLDAAVQVALR